MGPVVEDITRKIDEISMTEALTAVTMLSGGPRRSRANGGRIEEVLVEPFMERDSSERSASSGLRKRGRGRLRKTDSSGNSRVKNES